MSSTLLDFLLPLTTAPARDAPSFGEFRAGLAALFATAGLTAHPGMRELARDMNLTAACLFSAVSGTPIDQAAAMAGEAAANARRFAARHRLPTKRSELLGAYQAALVTALFDHDAVGLFSSLSSLTRTVDDLSRAVAARIPGAGTEELRDLTALLAETSNLLFPLMFLYRDAADGAVGEKVAQLFRQPWTQRTGERLREAAVSPQSSDRTPGKTRGPRSPTPPDR